MIRELVDVVDGHEQWRGEETINLIASEGCPSPAVHEMYDRCHDLWHRYAEGMNDLDGFPTMRFYQGQRFIGPIERLAAQAMKDVLGASFIDVRPISGCIANMCTFRGLSRVTGNLRMVVAPVNYGAHISHDRHGLAGHVLGLETVDHAFNIDEMNIDPDGSAKIIRKVEPGIVTFGGSLFQFPHPVRELADVVREVGGFVMYDAAHVLGLIAGGQFQDPLREGADFMTASTHKTFPGPQGAVIVANVDPDDERMRKAARKVQHSVFPLSVSNHHIRRLPALTLAALEMREFGKAFAAQTVRNAQRAGEYLHENGIKVLGEAKGFTLSHQIAVDVQAHGGGKAMAEAMERANIILNMNMLPYDDPKAVFDPSGLRIGFQEVTRRGFKEGDVEELCDLIMDVLLAHRKPEEIAHDVSALRARFPDIHYGFGSVDEALDKLGK